MGIFERIRGWITPAEERTEETGIETEEDSLNRAEAENRSFIFVVEDIEEIEKSDAVALIGKTHGTMCVDDAIYIYNGKHKIQMSGIAGIQTSPGESVEEVSDAAAAIKVNGIKKENLNPFPVLSSIAPQIRIDENENLENPRLSGLLMERQNFRENEEFTEELAEELSESHFLMAIYFDAEGKQISGQPGKTVEVDDKIMSIPLMTAPEDDGKRIVPIFTNWDAIQRWREVYDEEKPQVMIVNLFDARTMAKGMDGEITVNPLSEEELRLPLEKLDKILK